MVERSRRRPRWDARRVRALRQYLGLSQKEMARDLGTRQQTVSEWEVGRYQPRGTAQRLLSIIAERAAFAYGEEREGPKARAGGTEGEGSSSGRDE